MRIFKYSTEGRTRNMRRKIKFLMRCGYQGMCVYRYIDFIVGKNRILYIISIQIKTTYYNFKTYIKYKFGCTSFLWSYERIYVCRCISLCDFFLVSNHGISIRIHTKQNSDQPRFAFRRSASGAYYYYLFISEKMWKRYIEILDERWNPGRRTCMKTMFMWRKTEEKE